MTDRDDCEELVKLADEFDDIEVDAAGKCEWTAVANAQAHLRAQLRRLASSDSGVKVRELEWEKEHTDHYTALDGTVWHEVFELNGEWIRYFAGKRIDTHRTLEAAKAAAQADYEARIRSALVDVPADAGMREALEEARERLLNIWAGRCPGVGCEGDPVAFRDWATAYADAGVKSLDKALTALGATTKSDVEALAATTAERPGTVTSEPEPSTSDPSSTRSDVTALTKHLDQVLKVMRGARNRSEPMAVWADDIKAVEDARALLDQFEIRRK